MARSLRPGETHLRTTVCGFRSLLILQRLRSLTIHSTTSSSNTAQLYKTAGPLKLGTTIWTVLAMMTTNQALMSRIKTVSERRAREWKVRSGRAGGEGVGDVELDELCSGCDSVGWRMGGDVRCFEVMTDVGLFAR